MVKLPRPYSPMMNNGTQNAAFNLSCYLIDRRAFIDTALDQFLPQDHENPLVSAMRYSLLAKGKRIRPILCMATGEALKINDPGILTPTACALEMIHAYSLIHDDLPAMDDDDLRRGVPTCHKKFGEATAILAGDALLTLAFDLTSQPSDLLADSSSQLAVSNTLAKAAGHLGMVEGQSQDLHFEGKFLSFEALKALHQLKTGALIEAAVQCGAILAGADQNKSNALKRYAQSIGLAFQVTDDILNVEGDPEILGKAVGTDQVRGKNTYPSLLGLEQAKTVAQQLIEEALSALTSFDIAADPLRAIANHILLRKR